MDALREVLNLDWMFSTAEALALAKPELVRLGEALIDFSSLHKAYHEVEASSVTEG